MAFTTGNDTNIIQSSDASTVSAGAGDDTYILSGAFISAGQQIQITDTEGTNTIQLVGGLSIVSSAVTATATQLTLSNGATVTLLGANNFTYLVGGDSLTGAGGTTENYETFVTNTLGLASAPTDNTPVAGGAVEVDGGSNGGGSSTELTTSADDITGTAADDSYNGLVSSVTTDTTFNSTDSIIDTSTSDSDMLTITTESDIASTGVVRNIETVKVNADATTTGGDTDLAFAGANFTGVQSYEFDVTKSVSALSSLTLTGINDAANVVASDDFTTVSITGSAAANNITADIQAMGTTGTPVSVSFGTGTDFTVTGAGDLNVAAATNTGLLHATAEKGLTIDSATTNVHIAEAKDGNLTVANADAAVVAQYTATGNVSVNDLGAGKLTVNAGGTATLTGTINSTSAELSSAGTSTSAAANGLTSATLSGNAAAATYNLTAGTSGLKDVTIAGDQDVTLQLAANATNATLNVYDNATAGTFTLELQGTAGSVDTRAGMVDRLELDINNTGQALSVISGQNVTVTADQTGGTTFTAGTAAAEASNTLTLTLDDEARDANAVDLDTVTITQAKTVTIDASVDSTSTGAAVSHTVDALTASAANSNVTLTMGANNLVLDGATDVGTGNITVTGSGTVSDATSTITAASLDASAVTGAVTLDSTSALNVSTVKTGSAADSITLTNDQGGVFEMNAGNDSLTLDDSTLAADRTVSIDMGEGTDTLNFVANAQLVASGTSGSVTVAGIENLVFANGAGQAIQGSALNGQTYNVSSATSGNTNTVTVAVGSTATAVDMSQLVGSTANATAITGMTFSTDASANSSAVVIKGVTNAANVISGSAALDTLTGGTVNDIFEYNNDERLFATDGVMQDTIDGGTGTDSIRLTAASGTTLTIANTDNWSKLSNVESIIAGSSDGNLVVALDLTAQTAGITTVDFSADNTTGANTINASEYTTSITIKGSDTSAVDTITGGSAADTIVYDDAADLFTGTALIDSINGGSGTDILQIGTSSAGLDITNTISFARASNIETIKALASTDGTSIVLNADAWTAGIRTVDLSAADSDAVTSANASTIDVRTITGGDMTLIGSSAGATTFFGGDGADTMTGGAGNDTFNIGDGKDVVKFAASAAANGSDTLTIEDEIGAAATTTTEAADAVVFDFSAFLGSNYNIVGSDGITTAITGVAANATGDVDITGKLAIIDSVATAGDIDTAAELFALIDGSGDAFALSAGKAVVVVEDAQATGDGSDAYFFMIDTTADGSAGLSVSDITLVGTAANIDVLDNATMAFTTANFA